MAKVNTDAVSPSYLNAFYLFRMGMSIELMSWAAIALMVKLV